MKTKSEVMSIIKEAIAQEQGLSPDEIDDGASFFSLGLDSIKAVFILDVLEKKLGIEMSPLFFWDHPTIALLAEHLTSLYKHE